MKRTIWLLAAAMLLAGCSGSETSSAPGYEALPAASLSEDPAAERDSIINGSYDNFTFADSFVLDYIPAAAVYEVRLTDGLDKNAGALFSYYLGGGYDDSAVHKEGSSTYAETDERFALITPQGSICVSEKSVLNRVIYGTGTEYLSTEVFGQSSSETLTLGRAEVSFAELESAAEAMADGVIRAAGFPNALRPFAVSVQKLEDGTVAATVHSRSLVGGLPVFDTMSLNNEYSFEIAELPPSCCIFTDGAEAKQFTVGQAFEEISSSPCNVISPQAAMELASEKLSGYSVYQVQREELALMPKYLDSGRTVLRLEPYWVIWFETGWWHETFAAVSADGSSVEFISN